MRSRRGTGLKFLLVLTTVVLATPSTSSALTDPAAISAALDAGEALQKKGDYQGALDTYRRSTADARVAGDEHVLAVALQLTGGVQRLRGEYVESEENYREALTHAEKAGDFQRESAILNNLGNLFGAQSRYSETIGMLRRALDINAREGFTKDAAPWQNLAITYALQGDHARSLEYFQKALAIYEDLKATGKLGLLHYNLGVLQMKQGNYAAAKREYREAQTLGEKSGDQIVVAQSIGDLGRVQEREGRSTEALASMQRALALCRKFGHKSCIGESEANLGDFYLSHGETTAAAAAFERARETFEPLNDAYNLGQALRGLGYVSRLRADYGGARDYAARALALSQKIGDPDGQWQSQALLGLVELDSGNRGAARTAYREAVSIIERQRSKVGGGEAEKQRFFEKAVYPYQQLALLEVDDGRTLAALRAAESARARVLRDMVGGGPEKISGAMNEGERTEETKLLAAMAGLNARMGRVGTAEKEALRVRYEEAWGRYEAFRAALYVSRPELRTWRGEAPVIEEAELAGLLPDDKTVLLEFLCSRDRTLLFTVSKGSDAAHPEIRAFSIAVSREALGLRTEHFRALLEQRDPGFREEARGLFRLLLAPAAEALRGKTEIRLVADGPLWELPFQALITPSGRYWAEMVTMGWAPSLSFLRDKTRFRNKKESTMDLLAFGDPSGNGASVPVLREQVNRIGRLYDPAKSTVRVGERADETAFRRLAPDARVIHLATHGIADRENAMRSRVLLARTGTGASGNTENDGWLEAWELMGLNLHADLAVLSACDTGRGRVTEGEGLIGLTWALFASGVGNVVVSQWRVESESTTTLMTSLHRGLKRGESPAAAMRAAALSLMKDPRYRHPFYWGAFVAAGS